MYFYTKNAEFSVRNFMKIYPYFPRRIIKLAPAITIRKFSKEYMKNVSGIAVSAILNVFLYEEYCYNPR